MFKQAIFNNQWLFFHLFAAAIGAKIGLWFFRKILKRYNEKQLTVIIILILAIGWEVLEYSLGIQAYSNFKHFFLDACGDVIGAVIMAIIVVF